MQPSATASVPPEPQPKPKKLSKNQRLAIIIAGAFAVLLAIIFVPILVSNYYNKNDITIGDITITEDDISTYAGQLASYKEQNPNVILDGEPKQIAIDDLVMNAALKQQAAEMKKSLTNDEIKKALDLPAETTDIEAAVEAKQTNSDFGYIDVVRTENEALKTKLSQSLIGTKSLLVANINFDTPYFRQQPTQQAKEQLLKQSKDRLAKDFLPSFQNKSSATQIGTKADINLISGDLSKYSDPTPFFQKMVSSVAEIRDYAEGKTVFNDLNDVDYGVEVPDLRSAADEVSKLENIGDSSDVFASKTGSYMIVRLDGKSGGQYSSWKNFLQTYKDEYVPEGFSAFKDTQRDVAEKVGRSAINIASLGAQKANAADNCSAHNVSIAANAYVENNFLALRVGFNMTQTGQCGTININRYTGTTIGINCMNNAPTYRVTDPPSTSEYQYVRTDVPQWIPGNYNQVSGNVYVTFIYRKIAQPNGNIQVVKHKIENGQLAVSGTGNPPGNSTVRIAGVSKTDNFVNFSQKPGNYSVDFLANQNWYADHYRLWSPGTFASNIGSGYAREGSLQAIGSFNYRLANTPVASSKTTRVDVWYDPPPIGAVESAQCVAGNGNYKLTGWALDKSPAGYRTVVDVWKGNASEAQAKIVTEKTTDTLRSDINSQNGVTGNHGFDFEFSSAGAEYIYVYAINMNRFGQKDNPLGPRTFLGRYRVDACSGKVLNYPWLQTKNGDVTSVGSIQGQVQGPVANPSEFEGARRYDLADKTKQVSEGSFVLASGALGGDFCSTLQYSLGKSPSANNCSTGGYNPAGVDFGSVERAYTNAFARNGSGEGGGSTQCKPYNTRSTTAVISSIGLGCVGGGLQRIDSNYTWNTDAPITGRGAVWITGDLTISKNITYLQSSVAANPASLANLVIFVEGNITIDQSVTKIDAALVSMREIQTCAQAGNTAAGNCALSLTINGFVAANDQLKLGRRFVNKLQPSSGPAELINLTPQSIYFPVPGLSRGDADLDTQLQINSSNLAPRLK